MPSTIWHWKLPFSHFAIEITSLAYDDGFFISASTHHSDGIIITDCITSRAWQHDGRFKGFKAAYFQFFWVNSSHHKSCEFISHQWSSVVDLLLKSPHSTKSLLASQKDVVYFISFHLDSCLISLWWGITLSAHHLRGLKSQTASRRELDSIAAACLV